MFIFKFRIMRKFNFALMAAMGLFSVSSFAQCTNGRYASDVFPNVTTTSGIAYGANTSYVGANTVLTLDFYEPTGDTETARPLIIFAHGGSFIGGSSTDIDVASLCDHFAKKGYACASINYRLGFFPFDSVNAVKAVSRAVQDMKASIRFFYKDSKEGTNTFKIDTNNIFIGGSSAGAITALHTAYLDKTCELNAYLTPAAVATLGGIEGNSGNPCYSTKVNGVINLCGALAIYGWLEAGDLPVCSMHGTNDATVKYNRGIVNPGVPLIYLDGSRMVHEQAQAIGVQSNFYTWLGAPHVPYAGTSATALAYMDTTVNFIRDYLVGRLGCTETALQAPNAPAQTANLYGYTGCTANVPSVFCAQAGIDEVTNDLTHSVYPNPADNYMTIVFADANETHTVQLLDLSGRVMKSIQTSNAEYTIEKGDLNAGNYILKVSNNAGQVSIQHVMFY
jgi:poly(3-hydroxybutyrate) depolymerase